jgi:hypothetical protein
MSGDTDKLNDERNAAILQALNRIENRFDTLDSRTRTLENHVSVLTWAYGLGTLIFGAIAAKLGMTQ